MTDSNNIKVLSFYANKIHNNPEFMNWKKNELLNIKFNDIIMTMNTKKRKKNIVE